MSIGAFYKWVLYMLHYSVIGNCELRCLRPHGDLKVTSQPTCGGGGALLNHVSDASPTKSLKQKKFNEFL